MKHVAQGRRTLGRIGWIKRAADVDAGKIAHRRIPDFQVDPRRFHEVAVMGDNDFAICSLLHVDLHPVGTIIDRLEDGRHGVFRSYACRTTMGNDLDRLWRTDPREQIICQD